MPNHNDHAARGLGRELGQGHSRADVELMQERALAYRLTGEADFLVADQFFFTQFTALNDSGVSAGAILAYDNETDTLTVAIAATGVEAGQPHLQHIHGLAGGQNATVPTEQRDSDGDGFVELLEGVPAYGGVLLNIRTDHTNDSGDDNGHAHGGFEGFPIAPDGVIVFVESYDLSSTAVGAIDDLDLRVMVIHGMTTTAADGPGTGGEVNGTAGYKVLLPIAAGEIQVADSAQDLRQMVQLVGVGEYEHLTGHWSV